MWTDSLDENKFKITKLWKWPLESLLEMPRICCSSAVFSVIHSMASSALLLEKAYHLVCYMKMDELEVRVWSKIEWMTKRSWGFLLMKILHIETIWVHISICLTPICCYSITKLCPTLCDTMDCSTHQASLSFTICWSLLKLMSTELMMPSNNLILCHPFFSSNPHKLYLYLWKTAVYFNSFCS